MSAGGYLFRAILKKHAQLRKTTLFHADACHGSQEFSGLYCNFFLPVLYYYHIQIDDGRLYPLFYRNKFDDGAPVTDDIIILFYYAEVPKIQNYSSGEIIYRYR